MSKQLTISATVSVLAMALFAIAAPTHTPNALAANETGTATVAAAPALGQHSPTLSLID